MITIKLPYKTSEENLNLVDYYQREYSKVLRCVYNQKLKNISDKDVRLYMKTLNGFNELNCWVIESALYESKILLKSEHKIIFGSRKQFIRRCKGLITNEEYKAYRLSSIYSVGQAKETGNRLFRLNIIDNNQIIYKPKFGTKIILDLPKLKLNYLQQLSKLELLSKNKEIPFTIKLNKNFIFISFEEFKNDIQPIDLKERFLAIDLNPNHIGLSITEYKDGNYNIIHTCDYDLTEMIKINNKNTNKIKFETLELCKTIIKTCEHYKCKYLFLEDLNMVGKNHNKGKKYNSLVNNLWFRNLVVNNLNKRCNIIGIKCYLINAAYSSYIGNLQHNYSDPINASIEVGRRGYEVIILRNKDGFYPKLELKQSILHQWKEKDIDIFGSWKKLCLHIKNSKMRYRVSMEDAEKHHIVFRQKYNKPYGLFANICK